MEHSHSYDDATVARNGHVLFDLSTITVRTRHLPDTSSQDVSERVC